MVAWQMVEELGRVAAIAAPVAIPFAWPTQVAADRVANKEQVWWLAGLLVLQPSSEHVI